MPRFLALIMLLVAMVSIQFGASFAKQIFGFVHPASITMLRTGLAAIFLLALWRPWKVTWDRSDWKHVLPYGATLGIMNLMFYLSLQRIPLGIAVAVEFTGPLGLALFSSRRRQDLLWVLLAAIGILMISPLTAQGQPLDALGLILALGAGFCWALYIIFGKRMGHIPSGAATAVGMCVAALVTLPIGLLHVDEHFRETRVWWMGFLVAALSSALPYTLEMFAMKQLPTKTFGILMSLEPAIAALMGFMFLQETLSVTQWAALGCIMIASAGVTVVGPEV